MNAGRLLAHYSEIADAPDAVARLRRFVRDLAVRGALAPQDPRDEPASELLKRIAIEKAQLGQDKGKREELPHGPFQMRPGWTIAKIGQVLIELQTGPFGSSLHQSDYRIGGIPVVNPASIQNETIVPIPKMAVEPATLERLAAFKLRTGDIIMARRGEMGRCALVTEREAGWLCGTGSLVLRLPSFVYRRFFLLLLGSPYVRSCLEGSAVGATMQNLNQSILLNVVVGVPPVAEQRRIVAKVDELLALCDRMEAARGAREVTRNRLTAASLARLNAPDPQTFHADARFALDALPAITTRPNQIQQLRESVLNLAVRGKLVRQDPNDEPAAELLKRLKKAQIAACSSEGLRARPPVAKVTRAEMSFEFPQSWSLSSFDDLFVIVSGVTKGQKIAASQAVDAPYLRVANVQRGHLDLAVIKKITVRRADEERYALRLGDVLMTEGGDWDKLGRAAIWREEIPGCIHQNHIFRVRPPSGDVSPDWVMTYVNSPLGRAFFEDASKQTTNLASINMTQLRGCPFPLPPLAEQHRIVAKVDELMALCDRLEASLTIGDDTRRRLLDALLAEAVAPPATREDKAA